MNYATIRLVVWVIGVPIIVFLIVSIMRRVRAIRDLDARLREEEARNAASPYADMARLYEARELLDRAKRGK